MSDHVTDNDPCGWCSHRWDIHNHVTDECYAGDVLFMDEFLPGPDSCECTGYEPPV